MSFALVQHAYKAGCAGSSCVIDGSSSGPLAAIGAGHLLVIAAVFASTSTASISSVTGNGTFSACAASLASFSNADPVNLSSHMGVILDSTTGSSITINASESVSSWRAEVIEYSFTGTIAYESTCGGNRNTGASHTTTPAGVALTLGGSNDVIVQSALSSYNVTAISGEYTNPADFATPKIAGFAGKINTTDGAAPTWTGSNSHYVLSAVAVKETPSGAVARKRVVVSIG